MGLKRIVFCALSAWTTAYPEIWRCADLVAKRVSGILHRLQGLLALPQHYSFFAYMVSRIPNCVLARRELFHPCLSHCSNDYELRIASYYACSLSVLELLMKLSIV